MSQEHEQAQRRVKQRGISSIDNVRAVLSADTLRELICGLDAMQASRILPYPSGGLLPNTQTFVCCTEKPTEKELSYVS